jgi:DNA invertase Pin-like site-specific DNA recombinase
MADGKFIAYFRVSTAKQGRSGLGLEGQRTGVMTYLNGGSWSLTAEFTEVESGKNNDRPELAKALHLCRLTGATLVIAKLDRLSRDAHFLLGLEKAGVDFVAADMPHANRMTIGIMAVVADEERRMISARTKAALAAAKARGAKLGGWRGGPAVNSATGTQAVVEAANAFAARVAPMIRVMQTQGLSLNKIAAELKAKSVRTARGGDDWTAKAVSNVLARGRSVEVLPTALIAVC